ncbi:MAG: hypothetical protein C5B44_06550 [Acidobacteria bacterium]|nr:MAG: hypothetical protein C5B44_06550 [Acidobacteriota bacterium]
MLTKIKRQQKINFHWQSAVTKKTPTLGVLQLVAAFPTFNQQLLIKLRQVAALQERIHPNGAAKD